MSRSLLVAVAGLFGALGVAGSAAAAHAGGANLATASQFALFHAPAMIAAALLARSGLARPVLAVSAGWLMAAGVLLFSGTLALGAFGIPSLPRAAPVGGTTLILGWLLLAASGLMGGTGTKTTAPP